MRKVFAIMEGEQLPDGRTLDVGALYIAEDDLGRIPVCWANDDQTLHPEGWAYDFRRIEHDNHGDLSMAIIMNSEEVHRMLDQFEVYPYCTNLEEEVWDTDPLEKRVHKARIRMLQLVPIPGIAFGRLPTGKRISSHEV